MDLDIAAGRGLEEAVVQSTEIGAVNSWLRNQPAGGVSAAVAAVHEALVPHADGESVRLPGAMWLISACLNERSSKQFFAAHSSENGTTQTFRDVRSMSAIEGNPEAIYSI